LAIFSGLKPWEFDRMTWAEYCCYSIGVQRRAVEKWEQIRKIIYVQASSVGGMEITESEFMPLPYDEENQSEPQKTLSIEELNLLI